MRKKREWNDFSRRKKLHHQQRLHVLRFRQAHTQQNQKQKTQKFKVPKPNPKIRASESNISAGLMTSFKTPPPRPKPNRTISKVDFFQEDFFLKYEGSRIVFP